ncbi:MAG: xanthine dehydrogenase family protein subunit M [bacterium]|nr:xanthine dehydrogenase family protein subunit M [bacterium]
MHLLTGPKADDVRILAGGTDLLVQLRSQTRGPGLIVDVKRIPRLMEIGFDGSELRLGAAVCGARLSEHEEFARLFPGLAEAANLIGSTQVQGRASLGGNLCNASPAADSVPALIALGAQCVVAGPNGERRVPVSEFTTGPGQNALGPAELLVELCIPKPAPRSADAYLRFTPRTEMDIAVVGSAVNLTLDEKGICTFARVALGAVGPTAFEAPSVAEALLGSTIDEAALSAAASAASAAANPISDKRAPAEFRRRICGVLTRRAAEKAAERARRTES